MKNWKFPAPFIVVLVFIASAECFARDDTYSFGGSCPSQGAWTQMALAQTKTIQSVIEKLKDNPKCKGIESILTDISQASSAMTVPANQVTETSNLESLPGEIDALRKVFNSPGGMKTEIQNLLFKKTMTAASLSGAAAAASPVALEGASALKSLYARTKNATEVGVSATERIFSVLPSYQECLIGQPDQGMALVSAAVKIGASFASSGEGVGSHLGSAIASFVTMMRDKRFTRALRQNHETEFWLSVSCLLETTTKNYCDVQNSQELLDFSHDSYLKSRNAVKSGKADPNFDNPLEGYYLLVRELPMISQWLRAVRQGTAPKLTSDASFQTNAISKMTDMWKADKNIHATFAQDTQILQGLTDVRARRNKIFTMLNDLVSAMGGGDDMSASGAKEAADFFTTSMNSRLMPFYLIGMDTIPDECRASGTSVQPKRWDDWMSSSGPKENDNYVKQFEDPDALARTIESRMNLMIEGANEKAGVFFRQRLVIDLLDLVNQTLTGTNMTVRQALRHTERYLERFENRLTNSYEDSVMRGSVKDTHDRIQKVLKAYDGLANYGQSLKNGTYTPKVGADGKAIDSSQDVVNSAKEVIDAVFSQLNILYTSDVFLTNRMTRFIQRDFAIIVRSGEGVTAAQAPLLKIAQDHLVEKMVEVNGLNPTSSANDLMIAQVVNVRNLYSVEEVFSDTMYVVLEELNEIAHGRSADSNAMATIVRKKYAMDRASLRSLYSRSLISQINPFGNWIGWLRAGYEVKKAHPDLYTVPSDSASISGLDTPRKDFAGFRALLCAQTLAFEGRARFMELCDGAVLKGFYSPKDKTTELDLAYHSYLPSAAAAWAIKVSPLKAAAAKCALNNYNIRNWVQFLEDRDRRGDASTTD